MMMKKLAIASAVALMGMGAAHAEVVATPLENELGALLTKIVGNGTTTVTTPAVGIVGEPGYVPATTTVTTTPDISVLSGAVNTAALKGNIDISGTNVSLSSAMSNVTAKAEAIGTTSSASAYAIAGAKLSTTVIGAMNSATADVMGKVTEKSDATTSSLGAASLAASGGAVSVTSPSFGAGQLGGLAVTGSKLVDLTGTGDMNLTGLTSAATTSASNKVSELQAMDVFNSAINVAALDASIKVAATVDSSAWFLGPQTGVVNLSNIEMATTNIGAMNSSFTRLGVKLGN